MSVVRDAQLNDYVQQIGRKLASTPEAGQYPYTFKVVYDKSINAFALPGGPSYVHTGLITSADNEAQVAGVLAHEIALLSALSLRSHAFQLASSALIIRRPGVCSMESMTAPILLRYSVEVSMPARSSRRSP